MLFSSIIVSNIKNIGFLSASKEFNFLNMCFLYSLRVAAYDSQNITFRKFTFTRQKVVKMAKANSMFSKSKAIYS